MESVKNLTIANDTRFMNNYFSSTQTGDVRGGLVACIHCDDVTIHAVTFEANAIEGTEWQTLNGALILVENGANSLKLSNVSVFDNRMTADTLNFFGSLFFFSHASIAIEDSVFSTNNLLVTPGDYNSVTHGIALNLFSLNAISLRMCLFAQNNVTIFGESSSFVGSALFSISSTRIAVEDTHVLGNFLYVQETSWGSIFYGGFALIYSFASPSSLFFTNVDFKYNWIYSNQFSYVYGGMIAFLSEASAATGTGLIQNLTLFANTLILKGDAAQQDLEFLGGLLKIDETRSSFTWMDIGFESNWIVVEAGNGIELANLHGGFFYQWIRGYSTIIFKRILFKNNCFWTNHGMSRDIQGGLLWFKGEQGVDVFLDDVHLIGNHFNVSFANNDEIIGVATYIEISNGNLFFKNFFLNENFFQIHFSQEFKGIIGFISNDIENVAAFENISIFENTLICERVSFVTSGAMISFGFDDDEQIFFKSFSMNSFQISGNSIQISAPTSSDDFSDFAPVVHGLLAKFPQVRGSFVIHDFNVTANYAQIDFATVLYGFLFFSIGAHDAKSSKYNVSGLEIADNVMASSEVTRDAFGMIYFRQDSGNGTAHVSIRDSSFFNNHVDVPVLSSQLLGSALAFDRVDRVSVRNCTFVDNACSDCMGTLSLIETGQAYLTDTLFKNNSATRGGCIGMDEGNLLIENSLFEMNRADLDGGCVYAQNGSTVVIENAHMSANEATQGYGGHVAAFDSDVAVRKSFLLNGVALQGSALCAYNRKKRESPYTLTLTHDEFIANGLLFVLFQPTQIHTNGSVFQRNPNDLTMIHDDRANIHSWHDLPKIKNQSKMTSFPVSIHFNVSGHLCPNCELNLSLTGTDFFGNAWNSFSFCEPPHLQGTCLLFEMDSFVNVSSQFTQFEILKEDAEWRRASKNSQMTFRAGPAKIDDSFKIIFDCRTGTKNNSQETYVCPLNTKNESNFVYEDAFVGCQDALPFKVKSDEYGFSCTDTNKNKLDLSDFDWISLENLRSESLFNLLPFLLHFLKCIYFNEERLSLQRNTDHIYIFKFSDFFKNECATLRTI